MLAIAFNGSVENLIMESPQKFLLLDRDGVINFERDNYVLNWGQFEFKSDFLKYAWILKRHFYKIVVVTNQSCVGRGLLTHAKLGDIHARMLNEIAAANGQVDKVYYSTGIDMSDLERKPNIGLLDRLTVDYPEFDPRYAVMVGNRATDMQFAKSSEITGVHYTNNGTEYALPSELTTWSIRNWSEFETLMSKILQKNQG